MRFAIEDDAKAKFELLKSQGYRVMLVDGLNHHDWTHDRSDIAGHGMLHAFVQFSGQALKEAYIADVPQQSVDASRDL